eukprot:scaffold2058_cov115-Isochrysis_galbana.AAC.4
MGRFAALPICSPSPACKTGWFLLTPSPLRPRPRSAPKPTTNPLSAYRFRETLALAQAQEATCRSSGLPWARLLAKRGASLADAAPRVTLAYERLAKSSLGTSDGGAALLIQSASALFLFLGGLAVHPCVSRTVLVPEASPFCEPGHAGATGKVEAAGEGTVAGWERLTDSMLSCGEDAIPYLKLYKDKMCMWGAYLLAQASVLPFTSTPALRPCCEGGRRCRPFHNHTRQALEMRGSRLGACLRAQLECGSSVDLPRPLVLAQPPNACPFPLHTPRTSTGPSTGAPLIPLPASPHLQWGVARALSVSETSIMLDEALALRSAHAWSVPTEDALAAISARAPLIEMGAGNGLWAAALHARGADVLAFDTPRRSLQFRDADAADGAPDGSAAGEEGAPLMGERRDCVHLCEWGAEKLAEELAHRSLVLMWPDYGGRGSYGLGCLREYSGSCLILVGEWRGSTFGAHAPGRLETGQSFSAEFQAEVEAKFQLEQVVPLPSWPYILDRVAIWRRR